MKTRETIEAQSLDENPKKRSGKTPNPRSLANLVAPWTSETAPRNGGRPKKDVSQDIARQAFENNKEAIYQSYVELLLKGSAFGFQVLAERAYGKLKETRDTGSDVQEIPDDQLNDAISNILRRLGLAAEIDAASRAGSANKRAEAPAVETKDS